MPSTGHQGGGAPPFTEVATPRVDLTFALYCLREHPIVILRSGGSVLVRRRIQPPSDATVLSVVQPEGEVVLGASPPARRLSAQSPAPLRGAMTTLCGAFSRPACSADAGKAGIGGQRKAVKLGLVA